MRSEASTSAPVLPYRVSDVPPVKSALLDVLDLLSCIMSFLLVWAMWSILWLTAFVGVVAFGILVIGMFQ